ncbi:MAG: Rrf2 family transcriptional regulator [Lachnospiraceae bacterium]|nr:Rrf2 family transcriptional regulator [Lachnospiraceae bacterium]
MTLINKEADYALRIFRGLSDGEMHSIKEIAESQMIPGQFAYKILQKLRDSGLVTATRGNGGGCRLNGDLRKVTLFDLMQMIDKKSNVLLQCYEPGYKCPWREQHGGCAVHAGLSGVERELSAVLKAHTLAEFIPSNQT